MHASKHTNFVVALALTDGVQIAAYFANQSYCFDAGKYRTDSLEAADGDQDSANFRCRELSGRVC